MLSPIEQFRENITRVRDLGGLHAVIDNATTAAIDLTDLLRSQIVMIVSALDLYIHEITRMGMLEVYNGERPQTDAFLRFQVTLGSAMQGISSASEEEDDSKEDNDNTGDDGQKKWLDDKWLDIEIREKHGHQSFQDPNNIADAIRLFSSCELWPSVAEQLSLDVRDVRDQLRAIIKRRNQIVHEADLVPTYPGTITRWSISPADVTNTLNFIGEVCEAIDTVSVRDLNN